MPRRPAVSSFLIFTCFLLYAIVRYNVFGGVSYEHIPLFILNKVFSWTGLVLIGMAPFYRDKRDRKLVGVIGFALTVMHSIMSLTILSPEYLSKFFIKPPSSDAGMLTWQAETSLLLGILGTLSISWLFVLTLQKNGTAQPPHLRLAPGLGRVTLSLSALHLFFMGYQGWKSVGHWAGNGFLPPITLLAFIMTVALIGVRFLIKSSGENRT